MASEIEPGAKTTAIETHATPIGEYHKPSDGLHRNGESSRSIEMNTGVHGVNGEEGVDGTVLEHAIVAIEGKNKKWYAYLLTRDFWFVLLLGYFVPALYLVNYANEQ